MKRRYLAVPVLALAIVADEAAIPIGVALMAQIILDHQAKPAAKK